MIDTTGESSNEADHGVLKFLPRKKRGPDASKNPDTITTQDSIKERLITKYKAISFDHQEMEQLHSAVENFSYTLVQSIFQSRQNPENATKENRKAKFASSHIPRVGADEIWKALASTQSLRPIAIRFMMLNIIPMEYLPLFATVTKSIPSDVEEFEEDDVSESNEINPMFLDTSSQSSTQNNAFV
jgi:hypothetical protein